MSANNSNLAETKSVLLNMVAEARELKQAAGGSVTDAVAAWLAPQYLLAVQENLSGTESVRRWEIFRVFVQDWAKLRHGDHTAERLQIERKKLDEAGKDDQCKALEICLDECKQWPDVKELFCTAFKRLEERQKGKP